MPPVPEAPITPLYIAVGEASFALLGLWWVVVEFRHSEWMRDRGKRRGAYGVSLHFLLPGVMSVMALAAVNNSSVWRVTFCAAGLIGAVESLRRLASGRREGAAPTSLVGLAVLALTYALVGVLALHTTLMNDVGIDLRPLEAEGVLVGLLLLTGVNLAWLAFAEPQEGP
jgi:hypothetical protein